MARSHWDAVWAQHRPDELSWYQVEPTASLRLILRVTDATASVVDVGGGASRLVDRLLEDGYSDITEIDVAAAPLAAARSRLGGQAGEVTWLVGDITSFDLGRRFDLWHDRAVLHFLVDEADRRAYVTALRRALAPRGHVVIAAFGPEGPEQCSGLPVRRYDPETMLATLGDGFDAVEYVDEQHRTPAGVTQPFVYGLFRRRAR